MIISTWQQASSTRVNVVNEEHWANIGAFHLKFGTADVYLTMQEVINLKRQISDAQREYYDDYIYGKETA